MDERQELRGIVRQVKKQLIGSQEIRLDAPCLSARSMRYLSKGKEMDKGSQGEELDYKNLQELQQFLTNCDRCELSKERTTIVFGEGPADARLVFVGEAPGMEEDFTGRPFVGQAGRLLTDIIKAMGLTREEVYICNIVKCHPSRNRDPRPEEIDTCIPFLEAQISLLKPEIICTLGRISAQSMLDKGFKITRDRGAWYDFKGIPVMPTYHPAYLLRYPQAKRQVWEDIQKIMDRLGLKDPREVCA